jgi:hypothetical protein
MPPHCKPLAPESLDPNCIVAPFSGGEGFSNSCDLPTHHHVGVVDATSIQTPIQRESGHNGPSLSSRRRRIEAINADLILLGGVAFNRPLLELRAILFVVLDHLELFLFSSVSFIIGLALILERFQHLWALADEVVTRLAPLAPLTAILVLVAVVAVLVLLAIVGAPEARL